MPLPEGKVAIVDLHEELDVDPTSVLHGPLRRIRMLKLAPGKAHEMQGRGFEYSIFVLDGSGTASVQAVTVPIGTGVAVTTSGGESLRIEAAGAGLTAVCASFEIAPRLMESRVEK